MTLRVGTVFAQAAACIGISAAALSEGLSVGSPGGEIPPGDPTDRLCPHGRLAAG